MQLVRHVVEGRAVVGVRADPGAGGAVTPLDVASLGSLLELPSEQLRETVESAAGSAEPPGRLLPPIDGLTEVWASGVTYRRSSEARQEESRVADVYARVYDADRPELFFKSQAWRVCGDGEPIGIRRDSSLDVPEPELALVCNRYGELAGLTICDDVSSRSIEGANPLYLPQAKIYSGSCALGPGIVPIWRIADPADLTISVTVSRDASLVWSGATSTALMHRRLDDLIEHLFRQATFPQGAVLSTGTGLVPDLEFTLAPGDLVSVDIEDIGRLTNPVRAVDDEAFAWLTPVADRGPA